MVGVRSSGYRGACVDLRDYQRARRRAGRRRRRQSPSGSPRLQQGPVQSERKEDRDSLTIVSIVVGILAALCAGYEVTTTAGQEPAAAVADQTAQQRHHDRHHHRHHDSHPQPRPAEPEPPTPLPCTTRSERGSTPSSRRGSSRM